MQRAFGIILIIAALINLFLPIASPYHQLIVVIIIVTALIQIIYTRVKIRKMQKRSKKA